MNRSVSWSVCCFWFNGPFRHFSLYRAVSQIEFFPKISRTPRHWKFTPPPPPPPQHRSVSACIVRVPKVDCGHGTFAIFFKNRLLDRAVVLSNRITPSFMNVLAVAQQCLWFTCASSQDSSQPAIQRFLNKVFTGRSIDSKSPNAFSLKTGQTAHLFFLHVL